MTNTTSIQFTQTSAADWESDILPDGRQVSITKHGRYGFNVMILTADQVGWIANGRLGCFPRGGEVTVGEYRLLAEAKAAAVEAIR